MAGRLLVTAFLAVLAVVCPAAPAHAAELVVDATDLALTTGSTAAVDVPVINVSSRSIAFTPSVVGQPGCSVAANPTALDPGRRATVTFTLAGGCDTADGVSLVIAEPTVAGPPLAVAKAPDGASPLRGLVWGFSLSALSLVFLAVWVARELRRVKKNLNSDEAKDRRKKEHERLKRRVHDAFTAVGKDVPDVAEPIPPKLTLTTELDNLEAGWSFKDSWVVNLNIGSAAFVALLASSDVLTAVLGTEPKKALGTMAVAAGCAALLVALGSATVKVVGADLKKPTVGGLLLSAALVVLGTNGQLGTVAFEVARLAPSTAWTVVVFGLAVAVAALIGWYAVKSITALIRQGLALAGPAEPSPEVQAAWIVADADPARPRTVRLSPLEISQILDAYDKPGAAELISLTPQPRHPAMRQRASMI